jgi:hypothetical protein
MSGIESTQVKLRLTKDEDILKQLRKNKALRKNSDGKESYFIQFDSRSFEFRPGSIVQVGKVVANGLRRSSGVILGDHLTGDIVPALEVVNEFQLGQEESRTACPECGWDNGSLASLARHIEKSHKRELDEEKKARLSAPIEYEVEGDGDKNDSSDREGQKVEDSE